MGFNAKAGPSRRPAGQKPPLEIDPPQVCNACQRDWPVATFLATPDSERDFTQKLCLRCKYIAAETERWTVMYRDMDKRIKRAREREPDRLRRAKEKERSEANMAYQQQWATLKAAETAASNAQAVKIAGQAVSNQPVAVSAIPARLDLLHAEKQSHDRSRGGMGNAPVTENAPTSLRLAPEPLRSNLWLKMNYTPSSTPTEFVPQSTVYSQYYFSINPSEAIPANPAIPLDPGQPFNEGSALNPDITYPPPALRGTDFIASIPKIFPSVTLHRAGFVCMGLREKTEKEKRVVWRQIQMFMAERGLGGEVVGGAGNTTGQKRQGQVTQPPARPVQAVQPVRPQVAPITLPNQVNPTIPPYGNNGPSLNRFVAPTSANTPSGIVAPTMATVPTSAPNPAYSTSYHPAPHPHHYSRLVSPWQAMHPPFGPTRMMPYNGCPALTPGLAPTQITASQASQISQGSKRKRLHLSELSAPRTSRPASPAPSERTSVAPYSMSSGSADRQQTPTLSQAVHAGQETHGQDGVMDPFALKPPGSAEKAQM